MCAAVTPIQEAAGRDGAHPPFSSQASASGKTTRHPETGSAKVRFRQNPFAFETRFPCLHELLTGENGEARRQAQADLERCMAGRKTMRADAKAMRDLQEATIRALEVGA